LFFISLIGSSAARHLTVKNSNGTLQDIEVSETHMAARLIFEKNAGSVNLFNGLELSGTRVHFFLSHLKVRVAVDGLTGQV
jgi:hypothetical protein